MMTDEQKEAIEWLEANYKHCRVIKEMVDSLAQTRDALEKLADAADGVGVRFFDTDTMSPEVEAMQTATLRARLVLA